ncbi:MAG: tetratricopeptide repeat protein, partial [Planctomycetes bacterium]|nr:tetratricopeptide repeat protein [Planctomycetota bacterium]
MPKFQPQDFINHRYQVVRLLGQGAMGEVYLVEDMIKVHRLVALKVLASDNLDEADFWSKGEYEALTRLRHPNLARVHDFGRVHDSSDFYIVSEFIHGEELFGATRGIADEELLDILAQICRALEYIHTQGYVHFDVKPDNILVTRERSVGQDEGSKVEWNPEAIANGGSDKGKGPPRAKLIDFGLAEQITGTFNFAIKGTFNYVAPEIIRGQTPDKRADLYSLGVTIFQILTGYLPFVDSTGKSMDRSKLNWREEIRRPLQDRPSYLADIIVRLLEDNPDDRFPSARAIIQSLNAGSGRHFEIETAETQVSYLYCSRVVGRRKELNRLKEEAEAIFGPNGEAARKPSGDTSVISRILRDGGKRPPFYLISGEIGVGKSRLFEEFKHFLKMREIPVHTGNCYETNHDAYHPFRELIEQIALSVGLESEVFEKHRLPARRLCPKLRSSEEAEDSTGFRPDKERLYFIDGLANFIIDAAIAQPCVIDLNNLHWADEATVELLGHLIDRIAEVEAHGQLPLMVMATMRSDETLPDALRSLLGRLREDDRVRELAVRRFTRPQIAELIHNMLQLEEIPRTFLDRLEERTGGNPLFIVETLKGLQEEGIIGREGDKWRIRGGGDLSRIEIPHGIEAILLRRFRMLDTQHQRVLEALSVYDKPISGKFLEHFPEFARISVMSSLRELENRGMVAKNLDSGRLHFSIEQPKLREIIYENIPSDRRAALHGSLADALVTEFSDRIEEIVEDLSYHYQRSDRVGKALEYTLRAGDICRGIFAHERAVAHYRHVVQQVEGNAEYHRVWFDTHEKIGDIGTLSGDFDIAQASYDILLDTEYTGDLGVVDRSRILRKRGKLDEIRGEYDRALRCYKEACDIIELADPNSAVRSETVRVYNAIGWIYVCMGKYDKAMKIAADALGKVEGLEEKGEHAMVFSTIGSANYFKGNLEQAIEFHTRALEIRENLENVPDIIISLNNLGDAHLASAEYMEALAHYNQAHDGAEQIGDAFGKAVAFHNLSKTHLDLGDDERAEEYLRESLRLSRDYKMRYLNTLNYLLRGRLRRRSDDMSKAENDLFRALGVFAKQGTRWGLSHCLMEICELQLQRGNDEEAHRLAREAVSNAMALNVPVLTARTQLLELAALRAIGRESDEALLDRLALIARGVEGVKNVEILGRVEIERAEILVRRRDLDQAREAYRRADEFFREIADRLPPEFRDSYLAVHHVSVGDLSGSTDYREVTVPPEPKFTDEETEAVNVVERTSIDQ